MASILKHRTWSAIVMILLTAQFAKAQQAENPIVPEVVDTLNGKIETVKSDFDVLKRFKVSGYIQAQWQLADTIGAVTPFSGGAFPKYSDNRFAVRRGRIKFSYENEFSTYVLQLDATEKGVGLKDAYVVVKDPWAQFVTLTAGVFNRPFGYEITYSSSSRETPERARVFQTLFPQERDLGAMITLQPRKGSRFDWIKLDAGLFTGNGINSEFDKKKDFIGRLGMSKANPAETLKYGLGVSYYNGGVFQGTKFVYTPGTLSDQTNMGFLVDSTSSNKFSFAKRQYLGIDVQFSLFSMIGISSIRAEYLRGKQPGGKTSNTSISSGTAPDYDTYLREFDGGYFYFIQNIGQSKHQLVVKYDWLDPNTKVSGKEIKAKTDGSLSTLLSNADIRYQTLGVGWNYRLNSQIKFTAYYESVKNELTALSGTNGTNNYTKDLKDSVWTLRVQYKF
jgi:phosphate-selective porin